VRERRNIGLSLSGAAKDRGEKNVTATRAGRDLLKHMRRERGNAEKEARTRTILKLKVLNEVDNKRGAKTIKLYTSDVAMKGEKRKLEHGVVWTPLQPGGGKAGVRSSIPMLIGRRTRRGCG